MKQSIWAREINLPSYGALEGEENTDVLIIGGGLCGILCAYFLEQAGVPYILVEASRIASGITKNTTAKITSQHGLIYNRLISDVGKEGAKMYLEANQDALGEYERLCQTIDCSFEKLPSCTYSTSDRDKIEKEAQALQSLGFSPEFKEDLNLPFKTEGGIFFPHQAQFHPIEFIKEIAKNLRIYENTFIHEITKNTALSRQGKVVAKKIIVATHFPFINKHGSYFLKLYQHRSYVSAYTQAQKVDAMYVDERKEGLSFRNYGDLLLLGGGGHRTGKQGGAWKEIHDFASHYYPEARPQYEWATQDCMSLDGIPYIGHYSKNTNNLYVATGFNKWGMTSSMAAAKILCDMVQEKKNDFAEVFSPQRSMIKPQLFVNGFEASVNLLTPTKKRCPHLGCALKWNKEEHTWDCPCHGSRFDEHGTLLDNPAKRDAKIKE